MPRAAARGHAPRPKLPSKPLSPREEAFCQGIVAGLTKKAAYEAAGYGATSQDSQKTQVYKLIRIPEIHFRIQWLRMRQAMRLNVTMNSLVEELAVAYEVAQATGNANAMVASVMAKAKLLGFIDAPDKDAVGSITKPSPIPTDVVELSEEDWRQQFAPKQIN